MVHDKHRISLLCARKVFFSAPPLEGNDYDGKKAGGRSWRQRVQTLYVKTHRRPGLRKQKRLSFLEATRRSVWLVIHTWDK